MKFFNTARPYVIWAAIVVLALAGSYFYHPYAFAFTCLGLLWATIFVAVFAAFAVLFRRDVKAQVRIFVLCALAVSAAAVGVALDILAAFKWN